MRDLFGEWEGMAKETELKGLGGLKHLSEITEETQLFQNDVTDIVDNFKVS